MKQKIRGLEEVQTESDIFKHKTTQEMFYKIVNNFQPKAHVLPRDHTPTFGSRRTTHHFSLGEKIENSIPESIASLPSLITRTKTGRSRGKNFFFLYLKSTANSHGYEHLSKNKIY